MSALLEVRNLCKTFDLPGGETLRAVDDVNFTLGHGQTLGIVGESGSGKSTVARLVLRLLEPTSGSVLLNGTDTLQARREALRRIRRQIQIVFQDPFGSLLPHMSAVDNVAEPLRLHKLGTRREQRERARDLLEQVGVSRQSADRYPNEFSGGQQQRIAIARALAIDPEILVCDEPTSSLDVSIQAQILNLLKEIQRQRQIGMLFISHNLAVVEHLATQVAVMYRGRIVEHAATADLFANPTHPYTRRLLAAVLPARSGAGDTPEVLTASNEGWSTSGPLTEIAPGHWVAAHD